MSPSGKRAAHLATGSNHCWQRLFRSQWFSALLRHVSQTTLGIYWSQKQRWHDKEPGKGGTELI